MASTFTTLGIEKMATGENAGTWGDKTNTNIEKVEKPISGYVEKAITSGGTTALTITDGDSTESTSVARHAVIKLTGTITGNSIVTVPDSIEKVYIVTNGTSGAYTVQFKTASGTGITFGVSEKTTRLVYSDGTNLVDAGFGGSLDVEGRELVLDADGDTSITADTDDQIDIKIAGADDFQFTANTFTAQSGSTIAAQALTATTIVASSTVQGTTITATTAFVPDASDGAALGTSSLEFSDLFLADGAVVNFGDDQDVSLTHVADTGLLLSSGDQLQFGDAGENISGDGSDLTIAVSNDILVDATRNIILDADNNGQITFQDGGTQYLKTIHASAEVRIQSSISDSDILLQGNDGGATITALKLDMSAAGAATFNSDLTVGGDLTVSGDDITMGTNTAGNLLIADGTNFNSVAAGSLSEISTIANDDVFLAVDTSGGGLKKVARSTVVSGLATSSALSNIVEDTSPQLGGDLDTNSANILIDDAHFIGDENGNEQIIFQTTSSAVNQFDVTNAATSGAPKLSATGGDSNIDLDIEAKGTGHVTIRGNTNPGTIQFNCESNSHGQQLKAQAHSVASSAVSTLPDVTGELVPGKIGGTDFTNSLLVGHATTGTLDAATTNTGIGITALDALTTGDGNTAVGYAALTSNAAGLYNVAVGSGALTGANFGQHMVAVGNNAGGAVTSGDFCTLIGGKAGDSLTGNDSNYNLLLGYEAGENITTGAGNVIVGSVDAGSATGDRQLLITGYDGSTTTTWISGDSSGNLTFPADVTLGDDLHLDSDAAVLKFGDDGEVTLTHDADVGLKLKHTATADDKPIVLTLQTGETDMAANDVMGAIRFQAPDEGTGTDAILVAAAIQAVSEGDFSSSSNATKLEFHTGASEAASSKMSLSSAGVLTVSSTITADSKDVILGKIEGTNFTGGLLVGHATTGTLDAASENTGIGINALNSITSGERNTVVGNNAGTGITTGSFSTFIGHDAGKTFSTSFTNTAVGDGALFKSNAGGNTGLGANAGYHLTGAENTAVGNTTLQSTSGSNSGARNTAVGQGAGVAVTTGSNNSFFGHDGGANITTGSGNVIIGKVDAASATGSRQLKIAGNDGSTTTTWIEGDSDGTVSANGGHLTTTGKSLVFGF